MTNDQRHFSSASRDHLQRRAAVHVGLIEYDIGSHVGWPRGEHLFLTIDKIGSVKCSQFKAVAVGDGVGRAGLDAVSAKNAAVVIDVVNLDRKSVV